MTTTRKTLAALRTAVAAAVMTVGALAAPAFALEPLSSERYINDRLIAARIAQSGPMRLDDYMQTCLLHPQHGYYSTRDPFGAAGDFTTAPEISQMFGEMVGLAKGQQRDGANPTPPSTAPRPPRPPAGAAVPPTA